MDNIEEFDLLEEAPYVLVPVADFEASTTLDRYSYGYDDDYSIIGLGYAGLYNHSSEPNATYQLDDVNQTIIHYATRTISIGEEIFLDYGLNEEDFME